MLIHNIRIKLSEVKANPFRVIECSKDACFISCTLQNEEIVVYYTTIISSHIKADFQICTLLTGVKFDNPASMLGVNFNFLGTVQYERDNSGHQFDVVHIFVEAMKGLDK